MKRNIFSLLFLALLGFVIVGCGRSTTIVAWEGNIFGSLLSSTNKQPLVGATVSIPEYNLNVKTDHEGKFEFKNFSSIKKEISIQFECNSDFEKKVIKQKLDYSNTSIDLSGTVLTKLYGRLSGSVYLSIGVEEPPIKAVKVEVEGVGSTTIDYKEDNSYSISGIPLNREFPINVYGIRFGGQEISLYHQLASQREITLNDDKDNFKLYMRTRL